MASITVRNLDDGLKRRLRIRAAENGRSMEQEARDILRAALDEDAGPSSNLGTAIHDLFRPFGGVELEIPPRQSMREPSCPPLGGRSAHGGHVRDSRH